MKVSRTFPVYVSGEPEEVGEVEGRFMKVWAALGKSKTETIVSIFSKGLEALWKELTERGELKESSDDKQSQAISKKWYEITQKVAGKERLEYLYERMPLEEFIEFCSENSIDYETFLHDYRFSTAGGASKSKSMSDWLAYTLADGEERSVYEVREAAEAERLVSSDRDWNLMKYVASQAGYSSGRRGYWRKLEVS